MARVTYAALGLAFAALVGGFFIRTSSLPLIASIALSAVVSVLILTGWTRRMRREGLGEGFEDEEVQVQDIEMIEVEDETRVSVGSEARAKLKQKVGAMPPRDRTEEVTAVTPLSKPKPATPRSKPKSISKPKPKPVPAGRAPRTGARRPTATRSRRVFVIPGRERYHAEVCRYATGDDLREVSEDLAKRRGYTPCGLCLKKKR